LPTERFGEFLTERKYLKNVTAKTLVYYRTAFRSWELHSHPKGREGDAGDWKTWIVNLREAGVSPISINTDLCAMNAYWKWAEAGIKVPYLREEQKILATLSADQVRQIIGFKPRGTNQRRAHTVAMLILDTGLRISEALGLTHEMVDLENLALRVKGKGGKHRLVPLSLEMRRVLWRYSKGREGKLLFGTRRDTQATVRNFQRDLRALGVACHIKGARFSPHTLRHSFATNYLRSGGNLYYLQRILGHSAITTTERYLRSLGIEDLRKVHDGLSLLARG